MVVMVLLLPMMMMMVMVMVMMMMVTGQPLAQRRSTAGRRQRSVPARADRR